MHPLLKVESVQKNYVNSSGSVSKAVDNVSFEMNGGEFLGIMGASGSGKTTLLNMIATIDTPNCGHIYIDETDIVLLSDKELAAFRNEQIGFVFKTIIC